MALCRRLPFVGSRHSWDSFNITTGVKILRCRISRCFFSEYCFKFLRCDTNEKQSFFCFSLYIRKGDGLALSSITDRTFIALYQSLLFRSIFRTWLCSCRAVVLCVLVFLHTSECMGWMPS